jgi:hypothetical protein
VVLLALLILSCAVLEGLHDNLPAQFIQVNGLLALAVSISWVVWVAKTGFLRVGKE